MVSSVTDPCPNQAIRLEQGITSLPGCRAYELVTPPDSLARIEVYGSFGLADGDTVFFSSYDSLPGAVPNGPLPTSDSWVARRGADGWSTEWTTDAALSEPGILGSQTAFSNEDGTATIMHTETGIDPADDYAHSVDAYLRAADGAKTWLAPAPRLGIEFRRVEAASDDLGQILVTAERPLLPADEDASLDLYVWEDGALSLRTPGTSSPVDTFTQGNNSLAVPGTMSEDGSRLFFASSQALVPEDTDAAKSDLYVSEEGAYRLVSVDRRSTPGTLQHAPTLVGASAAGDVACFTTRTQFEDADTDTQEDIYCYDLETDTLERVSSGLNDNVTSPVGTVRVSDDGSAVLMTAAAALTADDLDEGPSLFRRAGGVTEYLAPLDPSDLSEERRVASPSMIHQAVTMNADASRLIFTTAAAVLPSDTDAEPDVYRWVEGAGFTHISIGPNGGNGPFASASGTFDPNAFDSLGGKPVRGRVTTDDGEAIFFDSADSLVASDTDGGMVDVYEWRQGEEVRLVTPPGAYPGDARYVDNSSDGSTVFFVTPEPILSQDVNGGVRDLYAARAGGGYRQPDPASDCVGDGCQGPASRPPGVPSPSTLSLAGRGNLAERAQGKGRKCNKGKRKVKKSGKVKCVPKRGKQAGKAGKTANKVQGGSHR